MALNGDSRLAEEEFLGELRRARDSGRRVPDFFIVGHAKCGTTALCSMLEAHPQIYMSRFKETQFLSRAPYERDSRPRRHPQRRPQTLEEYLSLFAEAPPEQRAGEGSTEYLRAPATAARIAELCPGSRIVAVFREPASFLRSLHLQLLQVNIESEGDFEKALRLEDSRRHGKQIPRHCRWPAALLYSQHVRYVEQLRDYHEHFGRDRVLSLIYDDFRADNAAVVRQVMRFLEIDDSLAIAATEANPTVRVRSQRAGDLVGTISVGERPLARALHKTVKAVTSERMRRRALGTVRRLAVDDAPSPPDEGLMRELRRQFKGEVIAASDYLERDLVSLWGYDEI